MAPSTSPWLSSWPRLMCSYSPSSTRRACSQPPREPSRVTWLPRCSATTPRRRSISARFCPYWPNRTDASLLSSKASTICVIAVSSEAAAGGITGSDVRKGVSSSCCGQRRRAGMFGKPAEQSIGSDIGDGHRQYRTDQRGRRHDLHRLKIWGAADQLPRELTRLFQQHIHGAADKTCVEFAPVAVNDGLQPLQALGFFLLRNLRLHVGGRRAWARRIHETVGAGETDLVQ